MTKGSVGTTPSTNAGKSGWLTPFLALNSVSFLLICFFSVLPIIYIFYLSMADIRPGNLAGAFTGLSNYIFVFDSPSIGPAIYNTLIFCFFSVVMAVSIGLLIALAIDAELPLGWLLTAVSILPWAVPEVVNALVWKWIFDYHWGALNALLMGLGILSSPWAWLTDTEIALYCLVVAYAWKLVPFVVLILYTSLKTIPQEVYESARVDGASAFSIIWSIKIPLVVPALVVSSLLCIIFAMRAFDLVYLLTKGGPGTATTTLSYYTYVSTFEFGDVGAGAAIAVMLAGLTLATTIAYWWTSLRIEKARL